MFSSPCIAADDVAAEDAPLQTVRFVDRNEGWAAGTDGVMLHTIDGGAHWERQTIPTKGRISSLQFLTPYIGVAAGREEMNSSNGSLGVLLQTRDGGLTWNKLAPGVLPGIQAAAFFDDRNGVAAGDRTDRAPSGLFRTRDGGQTWQTVKGVSGGSWLSLAFRDQHDIALAGAGGRVGTLYDQEYADADVDSLNSRNVNALAVEGKFAIAVGQGGLVLISPDTAGRRYGFADLGIPRNILARCDFHGVAMVGSHIWIVGRPGTVIFHSADAGKTWQTQSTGQNLPLNAVHFIDDQHGWAVGELGLVLATTDGGKTWTPQRRGGQRAAVLCVPTQAANMPLDLVAALGACDGYLISGLSVTESGSAVPFRLQTAIRKSGGAAGESVYGFGIVSNMKGGFESSWNQTHGGNAAEAMLAELVLAIRIWQPEVIVSDFARGPVESVVLKSLETAFQRAADPAAFPEQLQTFKLAPWQAKKLYTLWDGPGQPHATLPVSDPSRVLGDSPRDFAGRVSGLLSDQPLPRTRGLRLLATTLDREKVQSRIMDGILLAAGGTARRPMPAEAAANPAESSIRELNALINLSQSGLPNVGDPGTVLARVGGVLAKLPPDRGALAVKTLAEQYARNGQWALARETFAMIVERYPEQPAATDACRWLVRYHSSGEARRRHELGQFVSIARTEFRQSDQIPTKEKPFREGTGVRPLSGSSTNEEVNQISDPTGARRWLQEAMALEPKLAKCGPLVASDPAVRFCLNSAQRQLGDPDPAKAWLRSFLAERAGTTDIDPWRDAARMELWLMERSGVPPRPVASCRRTNERPHLDGKLDEAMWRDAVAVSIKPNSNIGPEYSTQAKFAFDDEYLYVAVECKHPADRAMPALEKRTRDADLQANDRVEIMLDIDRDYQTCYRLRVDQRGALAEDCWGDSSWNPRWFVAFSSNADGYTVEMAITLADLTGNIPTPGQSWAANIVRILPGRGLAAWSTPADVTPRPEGCGALIFSGTK